VYSLRVVSATHMDSSEPPVRVPDYDPNMPINHYACCDRSDVYASNAVIGYHQVANYPDSKHTIIDGTHPWVSTMSVTA